MYKFNSIKFVNNVKRTFGKKSPQLLMMLGAAGMITSTVLAVKATPKAMEKIEQEKRYKRRETGEKELKPTEVVKITWKLYIPAGTTMAVSLACLFGSSRISSRRHTALATAYALTESTMHEYQKKVIERIGEEKEREIRDEVSADRVRKRSLNDNEVFFEEDEGDIWYEPYTGRYFKATEQKIDHLISELNMDMHSEMFIELNEFFRGVGLPTVEAGRELGWNIDDGVIELRKTPTTTKNDKLCWALDFWIQPRYDFRKLM